MRSQHHARHRARRRAPWGAGVAAVLVLLPLAAVTPANADTADLGLVSVTKSVLSGTTLAPGQSATFEVVIGCASANTDGCADVRLSDPVPDPLVLSTGSVLVVGTSDYTSTTDANTVTVAFDEAYGSGTGLPAGESVTITYSATLPTDASADLNGTVQNTATVTADQVEVSPVAASATVTLAVPSTLAATATKSFEPTEVSAVEGAAVSLTLGEVANTSNTSVDALVVQDPADVADDPFAQLEPVQVTGLTLPTGADQARLDWYVDGSWQIGTAGAVPADLSQLVVPADAAGVRVLFSSTTGRVPSGATGGALTLDTRVRATAEAASTVVDTASVWVERDGSLSTPAQTTAQVDLVVPDLGPQLSKQYSDADLTAGESTQVTVEAQNGDFAATGLTVQEPAAGQPDLADQGLTFDGFVDAEVQWPVGATSAQVQYVYGDQVDDGAGGSTTYTEDPLTSTTVDTLPAPTAGHQVTAFTVVFTGAVEARAYAVLPFTVTSGDVAVDTTTTNQVAGTVTTSSGGTGSATAQADLVVRPARVAAGIDTSLAPSSVYGYPGATVLVQLQAAVAAAPDSTVGAAQLVVTDADPDFLDRLDLAAIAPTSVAAGVRLQVQYLDSSDPTDGPDGTWTTYAEVTGPTTYSATVPTAVRAVATGIRFVFEPTTGLLAPGFTVRPSVVTAVRATLRSDPGTAVVGLADDGAADVQVWDTAKVTVTNPEAAPTTASDQADDDVVLRALPGGAGIDLLDTFWLDGDGTASQDGATATARSGDQRTARLSWSTGGAPVTTITLTDAAGDPADVAGSVYDTFDLVALAPITTASDPAITFDQVSAVERYSAEAGGWVTTDWGGCPTACDGQFPGYTLTDEERADTLGVRFVLAESSTRSARTDSADDPIVGSGVAATTTRRVIDLVLEVRDVRRSAPGIAVVGSSHEVCYDVPGCSTVDGQSGDDQQGRVENTASALAVGPQDTWTAADSARITLLDSTKTVTVTTAWDQDDLGLPPAGTDAELYPVITQTLTATSTTPVPVDELEVRLPDSSTTATSVFEAADLLAIEQIEVPEGATSTELRLWRGTDTADYTRSEALALTAAELADVTGMAVVHAGRIDPGAATTVVLDFRLRATTRTGAQTQTAGTTVGGAVLAQVADPAEGATAVDVGQALADDTFELVAASYGVLATSQVTPATRTEADTTHTVTVDLTGQPTGNVRTTELALTLETATFWNAYAFTSFNPVTVASPIAQVRVEVLVDVEYTESGGTLVATCPALSAHAATDCWVTGLWQDATGGTVTPVLPSGVQADEVRGLRLTYRAADGVGWERPRNPVARASFVATRRSTLLLGADGGTTTPVPSTLTTLDPAPGETVRGVTTATLQVTGTGAWADPATSSAWTGAATATDTTVLTHLPTAVTTSLLPTGDVLPGQDVPYVMVVQNTGSRDLSDLGYALAVQTDTDGPMLQVPTRAAGDSTAIFTFTLRTAAGTVSSPAFVAGTLGADGTLTFTPPDGFVLPVGATLTVKAALQYRSDLAAGTTVDTDATVTQHEVARPFDTCVATVAGVQVAATTVVDTCTSTTQVRSVASTPIRLAKGVKGVAAGNPDAVEGDADYDDLGVRDTSSAASAATCASPSMDGEYYTTPCVPITRAGGTEQWRLKLTNVGNVLATTVSMIDVLPAVGDKAVILNQSRSSRWSVTFAGGLQWEGVDGATTTAYYLTSAPTTVCNRLDILNDTQGSISAADVRPTQYPGESTSCLDEVAGRQWIELTGAESQATLAQVRALKLVIRYPTAADPAAQTGLAPQAVASVTYDTRTADGAVQAEASGKEPVAWNSAAVGSLGFNPTTLTATAASPVLEPPKTGVALATGELRLSKQVAVPDGVSWGAAVPSSFTATLSCTSQGVTVPIVGTTAGVQRSTVTLPADGTVVPVNDGGSGTWGTVTVPMFATCAVVEDASAGATATYSPTSVVAVRDLSARTDVHHGAALSDLATASIQTLVTTNTYRPAGFTVTKLVDEGTALTQSGAAVTHPGPFSFTASCTLNGVEVLTTDDQSFTLTTGQTRTVTGLPAGARCQVVEATSAGAGLASTAIQVTGAAEVDTSTAKAAAFTLTEDQDGAPSSAVTVTNTFSDGAVAITKAFAGAGAGTWNDHDVTVHLRCTLASASPTTVYEADHTFTRADGTNWQSTDLVWTVTHLATGATCTVTEPTAGNGGASSTSISPAARTVGAGTTSGITVTNTFATGSVTVTKALSGSLATSMAVATSDTYTVELSCTRTVNGVSEPVVVPGGASRTVTGAGSLTYTGLPTGAVCAVTETDPGYASTSTVSPAAVTVPTGGASNVTVTNTFAATSVAVTKAVTGSGWSSSASTYQVTVGCTWRGEAVPLADGGVVTVARGTSDGAAGAVSTVTDIPDGSVCDVLDEASVTGQVADNLGAIDPVTTSAASTPTLAVVNTVELADVWVEASLAEGPMVSGSVARYRLDLGNDGPSDAEDVTVVDVLPAGVTYVGNLTSSAGAAWTTTDTQGAGSITLTRGAGSTLVTGAAEWVELDVLVGSEATGSLTSTATISTSTAQWTGHRSDTSTLTGEVSAPGDLALDKQVSPAVATIGQQVTYTVSVLLPKEADWVGAVVTDTAPEHLELFAASAVYGGGWATTPDAQPVVDADGGGLQLDLGDLTAASADRTVTITYTGTVLDGAGVVAGDTLTNTARVRAAEPAGPVHEASGTAVVTVVEPAVTVEALVDGVDAVQTDAGGSMTYTVTVRNGGTSTAHRVVLSDQVPAGVRVVSAGSATLTGADATVGGGQLVWPQLTLAAGEQQTFTVTGELVDSTVLGPQALVSAATVDSYSSGPGVAAGFDPDGQRVYGPLTAEAAVTPLFPVPTLTKVADSSTVALGDPVTFTVTVGNGGAGSMAAAVLVDTLPDGWVYEPGSTVVDLVPAEEPSLDGQVITWSLGATAASAGHVLSYVAHADPDRGWTAATTGGSAVSTNVVQVTGQDAAGASGHLDDHALPVTYTASADAEVAIPRVDLAVTISVTTSDPAAGRAVTWQHEVQNLGPDTEPGPVEIRDTVPTGLGVDELADLTVEGDGWQVVSFTDGVLTARHVGALAAGDGLPALTVTALVPADAAGATAVTLEDVAQVDGPTLDLEPSNDVSTASVLVPALADLAVDKQFTSTGFVAGEQVAWTIEVTNLGPSVSSPVVEVTDTLPAGIDPTSVAVVGPDWTTAGVVGQQVLLRWAGSAALAVGGRAQVQVTGTVLAGYQQPSLVNTATLSASSTPQPAGATDNDTDGSTLVGGSTSADLWVTTTATSTPVVAGATFRYRVVVGNDGPSDAQDTVAVETLPVGLTYAGGLTSSVPGVWSARQVLTNADGTQQVTFVRAAGALAAGAAEWVEFNTGTDPALVDDVTVAVVVSTSTTEPPDGRANTAQTTDPVVVRADVAVTTTHPDQVRGVGDEVTFTLTVHNEGPSDAHDVVLVQPLSAGLLLPDEGPAVTAGAEWTEVTVSQSDGLRARLVDVLPAGSSRSLQLTAVLGAAAVPAVSLAAAVSTTTTDLDPSDDTSTDTVPVDVPVLAMSKTATSGLIVTGAALGYTIVISNTGAVDTGTVSVADPLTDGLRLTGAAWQDEVPGSSCVSDGAAGVVCVLADGLQAGEAATLAVSTTVVLARSGALRNTATVTSSDTGRTQVLSAQDMAEVQVVPVVLASTGARVGAVALLSVGLVLTGAGLLRVRRRRPGRRESVHGLGG